MIGYGRWFVKISFNNSTNEQVIKSQVRDFPVMISLDSKLYLVRDFPVKPSFAYNLEIKGLNGRSIIYFDVFFPLKKASISRIFEPAPVDSPGQGSLRQDMCRWMLPWQLKGI